MTTIFKTALGRAALSQSAFALAFGVHPVTVNGWCSGRRPAPPWAYRAVALAAECPRTIAMWVANPAQSGKRESGSGTRSDRKATGSVTSTSPSTVDRSVTASAGSASGTARRRKVSMIR